MRHVFAMFVCLYVLFAYSLFAVANQLGNPASPPFTHERITVPATLKVDPIQKIHIGNFEAEFEKTTLKEIRDTLDVGSIQHAGDAGESQHWLCYTLGDQRIWFISHGEMGGSDHVLTQVQATITSSTSQAAISCPKMSSSLKSISFDFGWLGTTQKSFLEALGTPSGRKDSRLMYYYAGKKPGKTTEPA